MKEENFVSNPFQRRKYSRSAKTKGLESADSRRSEHKLKKDMKKEINLGLDLDNEEDSLKEMTNKLERDYKDNEEQTLT